MNETVRKRNMYCDRKTWRDKDKERVKRKKDSETKGERKRCSK